MPQCEFDKQNGERCRAKAIRGSVLCISHNPATAKKKSEAVAKGGRNRRIRTPATPPKKPVRVRSVNDLADLLFHTIEDLRNGNLDAENARAIGYLSGVAAKIVEVVDLERRVEKISQTINAMEQRE